MSYRTFCFCVAMSILALGCSDDPSKPGGSGFAPSDILEAPIGTVEVDGQNVTMQGSYFVTAEGEPLRVLGSLSDPDVTVERLWFLSGAHFERDDAPEPCFIPGRSCASHETKLKYELGVEFIVALDFRDSKGGLVRVRSERIEVEASPPLVRPK